VHLPLPTRRLKVFHSPHHDASTGTPSFMQKKTLLQDFHLSFFHPDLDEKTVNIV
ncbi:hypothetical protein NDU88_002002, partial [Pleurodeles waltl]